MSALSDVMIPLFSKITSSSVYRSFIASPDHLNRLVQTNLSTYALHQKTFPQFKGVNTGKDIVVVATGPTALKYKPKLDCKHIGINHAYRFENIPFDYFFVQDGKIGVESIKKISALQPDTCLKFFGLAGELIEKINYVLPESYAIVAGAFRYRTDLISLNVEQCRFAYDLSTQPLGDFGSVVFPAMQFALWTNPRRIYLVGCDCSGARFIDVNLSKTEYKRSDRDHQRMMRQWAKFKAFATRYYPDTEIVSINPVGLAGMFKDEIQN